MPKKIKEMAISVPIKLELSTDEQQILTVEIVNKKQILNNLSEKTKQEADLLSLINSILKIYETTPQSFDKTRFLKAVILEYKKNSEKIDWNKFQTIPPLPPTILEAPIQPKNSYEISPFLQELKAKQNLEKNKKEIQESMRIDKLKNVPVVLAIKPEDLDRTRLKPISPDKEEPSELEKEESSEFALAFDEFQKNKIKKQEVKLEKTATISSNPGQIFQQKENNVPKVLTRTKEEVISKRIEIRVTKIEPLLSPEEFSNREFEIAEKITGEEAFRLSVVPEVCDSVTSISMHFKSVSDSAPRIVEAILKPSSKI